MAPTAGSSIPGCPKLGVLAAAAVMLFTLSCDKLTGPHEEVIRELSWLHFLEGDTLEVEVPESVARNAPFKVTFMTYGGGCVTPDAFEVETTIWAREVEIVPYQLRPVLPPGINCPDKGWAKEREVTLRFEQAGQAEILLRGRRMLPLYEGGDTTELALTYEVDVVDGR